MDPENAVTTFLLANASLVALLTGGIYAAGKDTGLDGISRNNTPDAYGTGGYLKPTGLVKVRSAEGNWGGLLGNEGVTGIRPVLEVYLYDAYNWENLVSARDLVYTILQRGKIPNCGRTRWMNTLKERDPSLGNAPFYRLDFDLPGLVGDS